MKKISKSDLELIITLHKSKREIPKELKKDYFKSKKYYSTQNPEKIDMDIIKILNKIDEIFFSQWVNPIKLPAFFAIILTFLGIILQFLTFMIIFVYFREFNDPIIAFFIVFLLSFIGLVVFHVPAHYLIGLLVGIKTKNVFIASSSIGKANLLFNYISKILIVPGLKYDLESFLTTSRRSRVLFLSAGVWITYPLLYINLILAGIYQEDILPEIIHIFIIAFILGSATFVLITSWYYYGDLHKAKQIFVKREELEII